MAYIVLSLVSLLVGVAYFIVITIYQRREDKRIRTGQAIIVSLLALYAVIQMIFCSINILTIQGVNSQIILALMVGLVPISKGSRSGVIILLSLAYVFVFMYVTRSVVGSDGLSSWTSFLTSDIRANLIIINGLAIFISSVVYNLYARDFLKSVELEGQNERLEEIVAERTKELEEQRQLAEAASKAKSRFLSGMNHELRTPLNAITGLSEMVKNAPSKEKADHAIEQIEAQSKDLVNILNDMSGVMSYSENTPASEETKGVPNLEGSHILVVDDVDINRTVLAGIVEITKAVVDEASDGIEAVEKFKDSPEGYYSFIFMDIMMPRMDGNEAVKKIRGMNRTDAGAIPIVAVTANSLPEDVKASKAAGVNRHIPKPIDFEIIMGALNEYLS
jgi:CheY-like chemotaxis protein